jgi:hypothetical protein
MSGLEVKPDPTESRLPPAAPCHLLLLLLLGCLGAAACVAHLLPQRLLLHVEKNGATSCLLLCCSKP